MASTSEIFEQVRAATDIVDIIGECVALKRAGREFKGLCPFHDDHKPSMAVVPNKQIFHCFVCGTGGDVFKFVKEFHKLSNGEALRMLAQRAGIKLPDLPRNNGKGGGGGASEGPSIREQIAAANEWACTFFQKTLRSPEGKPGLDYLHSRGLTDETIAKFRLGFAPDNWTALVNESWHWRPAGAGGGGSDRPKADLLAEAGLTKKRHDGSPYDVFRNRVIFPIIDATGGVAGNGRVIAFGGRILAEKRDEHGNVTEAKYLNSPETPLFNKSASLYGLNLARQQIVRTRTAVVVEGYMDVIACHQAGVTNVIATLGTALTPEHARALKNFAQAIVLMFDSDDAGFRAADRALEVFVKGTLDIKLASVPDGKDPCDFCIKNGGEPFQKLIDTATDAMTYQWNRLARQFHATQSLSAKTEATTQFMRFVAAAMENNSGAPVAMDPIRRGLLFSKLAALVGMSTADVQSTLKHLDAQSNPPTHVKSSPGTAVPGLSSAANNWPSMPPADTSPPPARIDIAQLKGLNAAEGWLLGALLAQPPLYDSLREGLSLCLFQTFTPLAAFLLEYFDNHPDLAACTLAELASAIEDPHLLQQAIELERKTSDWLDPANFSPAQTRLLKQSTDDRGLTLAGVAMDSLKELQTARAAEDPAIAQDLDDPLPAGSAPADSDVIDFSHFESLKRRNAQGGNRRITGI